MFSAAPLVLQLEMAANFFSRFLPPSTNEPSIYEALREQDESEQPDIEERAAMTSSLGQARGYRDEGLDHNTGEEGEPASGFSRAKLRRHWPSPELQRRAQKQKTTPTEAVFADIEDEVPQSLLIEDKENPRPNLETQQQVSSLSPVADVPQQEVQAKWQATQKHQKLHSDIVPPQLRPSGGVLGFKNDASSDPTERALWMWANVSNLDIFLKDVYDYYTGNGIWCITLSRILDLLLVLPHVARPICSKLTMM